MGKSNDSNPMHYQGRVGNTIGYYWRGKWCMRALPAQYKDARTESQIAQRNLFKLTVGFASRAKQVIYAGLRLESERHNLTESNYFMRINKGCFAVVDNELAVDYESLQLSDGPVAPVAFNAPQLIDETTVSITFEKNPLHRSTKSDDMVRLVAYCPELGDFDISAPAYRRGKQLEMKLNKFWAGREVHLWGFVTDNAGRASQTLYIGSGILATDEWESEETEDESIDALDMTAQNAPQGGNATSDAKTAEGANRADGKKQPPKNQGISKKE